MLNFIINLIRKLLKGISNIVFYILPKRLFIKMYICSVFCINKVIQKWTIKKFNLSNISELKQNFIPKSDTVFILGSGETINNMSEEDFDLINEHDSIGFNFWIIHKFVPSLLVFEENKDESRNENFYDILELKEKEYEKTPIIVKDLEYKGISINLIPKKLIKNIYCSCDLPLKVKDISQVQLLKILFNKIKTNKNLIFIPKIGGSLSYNIFLAKYLGYKKIVLCGVDLYTTGYFYEKYIYDKVSTPRNELILNKNIENTKNVVKVIETIETLFKNEGVEIYKHRTSIESLNLMKYL